MNVLIGRLLCWLGFGTIEDGSVCEYGCHDYHIHRGGDGMPSHFYVYTCPRCGENFTI